MRKLLFILVLFNASTTLAETTFNCEDLIGSWQGDRYDYTAAAQRTASTSFFENSSFYTQFAYDSGNSQTGMVKYGKWKCESNILTLTITPDSADLEPIVDYYEIVELNSSYFVYRALSPDCEGRFGDCGEITYDTVRVDIVYPEHDGC